MGLPSGSDVKEPACNAGDLGSIPGLERSPGGGHGNPLQYSCLENPLMRGAWWAIVHRVAESDTTEATEHMLHMASLVTSFRPGEFFSPHNCMSQVLVIKFRTYIPIGSVSLERANTNNTKTHIILYFLLYVHVKKFSRCQKRSIGNFPWENPWTWGGGQGTEGWL